MPPCHLDLGTTEEYYGIPYSVVPAAQPLVPISFGTDGVDYSDESDPGPMPIPPDAPIEGGSSADPDPASGDRHVLVVRRASCTLYELYNAVRVGRGLSGELVGRLGSDGERHPPGRLDVGRRGRIADSAGPPPLRRRSAAGAIGHALRFTILESAAPTSRRRATADQYQHDPAAIWTAGPAEVRILCRAYSGAARALVTALKRTVSSWPTRAGRGT